LDEDRALDHTLRDNRQLVVGENVVSCSIAERDSEFFIDKLLVQIHLIIEMILVDWPCAMEV
jgi:hypothetical protein